MEDVMDRAQDVLVVKTVVKSLGINPRNMLLAGKEKGPQQFCVLFIFASNFCMCEIRAYAWCAQVCRRCVRESQRIFSLSFSLIFSFSFPPFI